MPVTHDEARKHLRVFERRTDGYDALVRYIDQQEKKDATISELTRQRDEAVRVLKSVEWSGGHNTPACPSCRRNFNPERCHWLGCALKAAIEAAEGKANG